MKKVLFSVAMVAALGLASCGGPGICDCMTAEQQKTDGCVALKKEWSDKMEKAEGEDKEKIMEEMMSEAEKCEKKDEESEEEK